MKTQNGLSCVSLIIFTAVDFATNNRLILLFPIIVSLSLSTLLSVIVYDIHDSLLSLIFIAYYHRVKPLSLCVSQNLPHPSSLIAFRFFPPPLMVASTALSTSIASRVPGRLSNSIAQRSFPTNISKYSWTILI